MRYRVYHVFSFDETNMKNRKGCILISTQDLLFELQSIDKDLHTIPRKRITSKFIETLMNPLWIEMKYLDYIKSSTLVIKEYELLPHNSSK